LVPVGFSESKRKKEATQRPSHIWEIISYLRPGVIMSPAEKPVWYVSGSLERWTAILTGQRPLLKSDLKLGLDIQRNQPPKVIAERKQEVEDQRHMLPLP
jgi:hypothetical protein